MFQAVVYPLYGLPSYYAGLTFAHTGLSKAQQERFTKSIENAPPTGVLAIRGMAAPVVNLLLEQKRKVRGIDFTVRSQNAFEEHQNPAAEVIVIYNVGVEITGNSNISKKILRSLIQYYKERQTLVIIESTLGKSDFRLQYDIDIANFITIPEAAEAQWI